MRHRPQYSPAAIVDMAEPTTSHITQNLIADQRFPGQLWDPALGANPNTVSRPFLFSRSCPVLAEALHERLRL